MFIMAADKNHRKDSKIDMSVPSQIKCTLKQDLIKQLLEDSIHNSELKINNDALKLVVEVANCIVIETCMRAASQAIKKDSIKVDHEHLQECLPQLMLDFP